MPFEEIGRGTFGVIFTDPTVCGSERNAARILKRTLQPNIDPKHWLECDAEQHGIVFKAITDVSSDSNMHDVPIPCIPRILGLIEQESSWWLEHGRDFQWTDASGVHPISIYSEPSLCLSAQQIPSVCSHTTLGLLQRFHSELEEHDKQATIDKPENRNVLLRIYFGILMDANLTSDATWSTTSHKLGNPRKLPSFRNYPLSRDRLKAVLSASHYVKALEVLATALAILHWKAHCDARDVEFVFGSPGSRTQSGSHPVFDLFGRRCQIWLLDFNQVGAITVDEDVVKQAVLGFLENDPYYPSPADTPEEWSIFEKQYLDTSRRILEAQLNEQQAGLGRSIDVLRLPQLFADEVVRRKGRNDYQQLFSTSHTTTGATLKGLWTRMVGYFVP